MATNNSPIIAPKEKIFRIKPSLQDSIQEGTNDNLPEIVDKTGKLNNKATELLTKLYAVKQEQQRKMEEEYEQEFYQVKLDYDKYFRKLKLLQIRRREQRGGLESAARKREKWDYEQKGQIA